MTTCLIHLSRKHAQPNLRAAAFAAFALCASTIVAAPVYSVPFTVSGYAGADTLQNFPLLVRIAPAVIHGFAYSQCRANGADISFALEDGTTLPHEVDTWNTNGESLVWVKLPSLAGKTTKFKFRWNDPSPAPNDPTAVWDDYVCVLHFNEDGGTNAFDSTANHLDATAFSDDPDAFTKADGMIGAARSKTVDTKFTIPDYSSLAVGSSFTISCHIRASARIGYDSFWAHKKAWNEGNGFQCNMQNSDTTIFLAGSGATTSADTVLPNVVNTWTSLTLVYDNTSLKAYNKGTLLESKTILATGEYAGPLTFDGFIGLADEMRLRRGAVSADWVKAEYDQVAKADFLTAGDPGLDGDAPAVFSWTGAAGDGKWTTPGNWSARPGAADAYPGQVHPFDIADFASGTSTAIDLDRDISLSALVVSNAAMNLVFSSSASNSISCGALRLGTGTSTANQNTSVEFNGISVSAASKTATFVTGGISVTLSNHASLSLGGSLLYYLNAVNTGFRYPLTYLRVRDGSALSVGGSMVLAGKATMEIDDASVSIASQLYVNGGYPYTYYGYGNYSDIGGGSIRILGSAPSLTANAITGSGNRTLVLGGRFEFVVPAGGYAAPPIQVTGATKLCARGGDDASATAKHVFEVRADSPAAIETTYLRQVLATTAGGVESQYFTGTPPLAETSRVAIEGNDVVWTRHAANGLLKIGGEPLDFVQDAIYTNSLAEGTEIALTAPTSPSAHLVCAGYRIYDVAANGSKTLVRESSDTTCSYVHGSSRREFDWVWIRPAYYVTTTGSDDNTGADWEHALATPAKAVELAADFGRVVISNGTYTFGAADAVLSITSGVEVAGVGDSWTNVVLKRTGGDSLRVLSLSSKYAVVTNLTVTNGKVLLTGGIAMSAGNVLGCRIYRCYTRNNAVHGGGVSMSGGKVYGCVIEENCARSSGGAGLHGNGVYMTGGTVENCRIVNNGTDGETYGSGSRGGGVWMSGGTLRNCLVAGNRIAAGFGVYADGGTVESCTIADNLWTKYAVSSKGLVQNGGVCLNNIVWGSRTTVSASADLSIGATVDARNICSSTVNANSENSISVDPAFNADYTLGFSACVNGAYVRGWMPAARDMNGNARILGPGPDIGCFERPVGDTLECAFTAESDGRIDASSVTLSAIADGNTEGAVYYWTLSDADGTVKVARSGADLAMLTLTMGPGDYTVSLAVTNGANQGAECTVENSFAVKASVAYVNAAGTNARPFASRETGAHDFFEAFSLLGNGGTLYVAEGVYALSSAVELVSGMGAKIIGLDGPEKCVVVAANCAAFTSQAMFMFKMTAADSLLSGITVAGGAVGAYRSGGAFATRGAVIVSASSAVVSNCVVCDVSGINNDSNGVGIRMSAGKVTGTTIRNVYGSQSGGISCNGMALYLENGTVENSRVTECYSTGWSSARTYGQVVYAAAGSIRNTVIDRNSSNFQAPVYITGATLDNCTVVSNRHSLTTEMNYGYDVDRTAGLRASSAAVIRNTVIDGNWAVFTGSYSNLYWSAVADKFSKVVVNDRPEGSGVIGGKVEFAKKGLYVPKHSSGLFNRGDLLDWMDGASVDYAGNRRVRYGSPDIGAVENQSAGNLMIVIR